MQSKLFFTCLLFAQLGTMVQGSPHDLHKTVVQNVSKILNKSDCWICTQLLPLDGKGHWPLIGILMEENCTETWEPINSTLLPPITLSGLVERANYKVPCAIVNATGKAVLPSYCHQTHFREIIDPRIAAKMKLTGWRLAQPFGTGLYWICGDNAWKVMPVNKDQACAIGAVVPNRTIFDHLEKPNERKKRSLNPLIECPTLFHGIIRALVPAYGVVELERAIVNILAVIERIKQHTADAISALQEEVGSLSRAVMQNRIALNFILVAQGGVCAIVSTNCCSYVDQSGRIKKDLDEIWKGTQILHEAASRNNTLKFDHIFDTLTSWLPNWAWVKEIFIIVVIAVIICVISCGAAGCVNQFCG
uniref:Uncharacterized protein n=1 Tax=Corvus moneduloides TaxID=1196302 RepID=A0A8C3EAP4_CORMO